MWYSPRFHIRPYTVSNIYKWYYKYLALVTSHIICRWHQYIFTHKNIENFIDVANTELKKLTDWFIANHLSLNVAKRNFILFCNSHKYYDSNLVKIVLTAHVIEQLQLAKFVGVYIDERLNWDEHIKQVSDKISKDLGAIRRLKKIVTYYKLSIISWSCLILLTATYLVYCITQQIR